jgi:hypothetical protein
LTVLLSAAKDTLTIMKNNTAVPRQTDNTFFMANILLGLKRPKPPIWFRTFYGAAAASSVSKDTGRPAAPEGALLN